MWSKLRRNVRAHKFRLKLCGASQYKPNRSKSTSRTFDRGSVYVKACPMVIARAHLQQSAAVCSSRAAARGLALCPSIPFCLGISGHPSGSRQGHPRYTGVRSAGRPWVARIDFQSQQCSSGSQQTKSGGALAR